MFKNMSGDILGGNFLGGNFPGGSLMGGNFLGGSFPDTKMFTLEKNMHIWFVVNRFIILSCKSMR